jgi:hypothetical protein
MAAMSPAPSQPVEPCFRCGQPAEKPTVGQGHVAGERQGHVPLCVDCLELMLRDAEAFWAPLRQRRQQQG